MPLFNRLDSATKVSWLRNQDVSSLVALLANRLIRVTRIIPVSIGNASYNSGWQF